MPRTYSEILRGSLIGLLLVAILSGCSKLPKLDKVLPDNREAYKKSESLPDLEVPPDLSTAAIKDRMTIPSAEGKAATFSTYQERVAERKREVEVDKAQNNAIKLIENEHILAVEGAPVQIWPKLREFWKDRGYSLQLDDEELGVIETDWHENQKELTRDRFKIFAESGSDPGTTLLYISHRGEALVQQGDTLQWQSRGRDVNLERSMVELIQERISGKGIAVAGGDMRGDVTTATGPSRTKSVANARAELINAGEGKVYLAVKEEFPAAWESTGLALGRAGVVVDQADMARGVYYIRLETGAGKGDKKGVWSKLKFWGGKGSEVHQLSLTGVGDKTEVVVLDEDGKWETSDAAGQLLSRLHDELNSGQI